MYADLTDAKSLRGEYDRYCSEVAKDPLYGSKRAERNAKQRSYHYNKKKQAEPQDIKPLE